MNKIFSILLCCLYLGTSQTALFGKNYKEQNPHETPRSTENQRLPVARQLFPSILPIGQITIPSIPAAMQPTSAQATQARTNAGAAQLHNEYAAQMAPRRPSAAPVNATISDDMFSESELSSADERAQTPRPTRTIGRQNNLPDFLYTQVHSNHRNFIGESRARRLDQSPLIQITVTTRRDSQSPRILVIRLTRQEFIARLQAARRARQERNNRRYNCYDAQD